jgi:steroid delta-isomerase-like uncharacterized protein
MILEECIEVNRRVIQAFIGTPTAVSLADEVSLEDLAQNRAYHGRAAVEALLRAFFVEGFSEARTEVRTMLVDERAAMLEFTFHGRQNGPFLGIPVTGQEVAVPMVVVCQIGDGQIRQATLYYDAGSFLRQLGMAV